MSRPYANGDLLKPMNKCMTKYCNNSIFQILIFAFFALQIVSVPLSLPG